MEMRQVFGAYLDSEMEKNPDIILLDADLARANGTLPLHNKYKDRAIDVGIQESNMVCVAAGLSSYGFIPYCTTFTPFMTRRVCDQVAISGAYAKSNIKCVGTDPGIAAELNGGTHMSVEDLGVLRSIPEMTIVEPCDEVQLKALLPQITAYKGMVYLRLFRKQTPVIYDENEQFDLFKAKVMREGTDITILTTGIMVKHTLDAVEMLKEKGINAEVINVFTLKPLDKETIIASAKKTGKVLTCENHNVVGGLYSATCEALACECPTLVKGIGIPDVFGEVGKMPDLLKKFGMTAQDICDTAVAMCQK